MPDNQHPDLPEDAFRRMAVESGLDVSDPEKMSDLYRRVALMRQGLSRIYEIDVSGSESPSAFVPLAGNFRPEEEG